MAHSRWGTQGAAITTPDAIYLGFGFEGISDSANRNEVMARALLAPTGGAAEVTL